MAVSLTLGALLEGVEAELRGCQPSTSIAELSTDPSAAGPEHALVAFPGLMPAALAEAFCVDAQAVLASRAGLLITHRAWAAPADRPLVLLAEPMRGLGQLAANRYGRPSEGLRIAGVTGTNGKTTSTWLVASMLRVAGRPFARIGTNTCALVGEERATPFTSQPPLDFHAMLATAVERGARDLIMEVSSHGLAELRSWPAQFCAIGMTNLGWDHLDYHGSEQAYRAAKLSFPEHLAPGGVAVAHIDDGGVGEAFLSRAQRRADQIWRAARRPGWGADIQVSTITELESGYRLELDTPGGRGTMTLPLWGMYNVENALIALGLGLGLGLELELVLEGIRVAEPPPGRSSWVSEARSDAVGVVVDYAHTPDALLRVIEAARARVTGELWVVTGCGGDRDRGKRPAIGRLVGERADHFVATMNNPRGEDPERILDDMLEGVEPADRAKLQRVPWRPDAIRVAIAGARPGDVVLIAGKGAEASIEIGGRKLPHVDGEVALEALAARAAHRVGRDES